MRQGVTTNIKASIAITIMVAVLAVPIAAGVACCVVGPLARSSRPKWVAVTTLETLPIDGTPRKFPIIVTQSDAWCHLPDEVIGYVYLRRVETPTKVQALRTTNHAGCLVEFNSASRLFEDPCWKGRWDIDGQRLHSVPEWKDLRKVRTAVDGEVVAINLSDAIP